MAELNLDGMAIAPGVVETIVSLAAQSVNGVAYIGDAAASGIRNIIGGKPSTQGVEVDCDENGKLHATVHLCAKSGQVLPDLANNVRQAVADAISGQVGVEVGSVDLYIDNIQFDN